MKRVVIFIGLKLVEIAGIGAAGYGLWWFGCFLMERLYREDFDRITRVGGVNAIMLPIALTAALILGGLAVTVFLVVGIKWNWERAGKWAKHLSILILLLSPYAWSQYPQSQSLPDAYTLPALVDSSLLIFYSAEPFRPVDPYSDIFIPRLLTDWEAYTEECDSTFIYNDGFEYERMTVERYREVLAGWLGNTPLDRLGFWYSEPSTLPGFMLCLERKYPQKGVKP